MDRETVIGSRLGQDWQEKDKLVAERTAEQ
jgi:hypothetical protein